MSDTLQELAIRVQREREEYADRVRARARLKRELARKAFNMTHTVDEARAALERAEGPLRTKRRAQREKRREELLKSPEPISERVIPEDSTESLRRELARKFWYENDELALKELEELHRRLQSAAAERAILDHAKPIPIAEPIPERVIPMPEPVPERVIPHWYGDRKGWNQMNRERMRNP